MAITLVASVSTNASGSTTSITTSGIDTTGANLLVAAVAVGGDGSSFSDSKGNTWTPLTNRISIPARCRLFYAVNPTVGSGHTFTGGFSPADFPSIAVIALAGANTTAPFDQENGGSGPSTGSVTPSVNNEVLVAAISFFPAGTLSIDSSFSIQQQISYGPGTNYGIGLATKIQTTAGAENPTWSNTGGFTASATAIATFKAGAAGASRQQALSLLGCGS